MLNRYYMPELGSYLVPGKALIVYGPRQVGKTTLLKSFLSETQLKYRLVTGEDLLIQQALGSQSIQTLQEFVHGYELLVIDEAQNVPNIGLGLKLLVDHVEGLRIIATGSASFDLATKVGEPLTGRKITRILYPLAQLELLAVENPFELRSRLNDFLIFGSYPEVLTAKSGAERKEVLMELVGSYLLKDVLALGTVRQPRHLLDLLKLLAFQIGHDVSLSKLASDLSIDFKTVSRYLDLLEKSFVIISVSGFSRNLRKEIAKSRRYFFLDNGIRNAIIANFNALELRNDSGALWENFVFMERMKRNHYKRVHLNSYFWRTYDRKEIDLVEEYDGRLEAYEFKFGNKKAKLPTEFLNSYEGSRFKVINRENYLEFVGS